MARRVGWVVVAVLLTGVVVWVAWWGLVGVLSANSAVGREPGSEGLSREEARAVLYARPDVESELARLQGMLVVVQDRFGAELGLGEWTQARGVRGAGCGVGFAGLGGETQGTELWRLAGGIPDGQWDAAMAIVVEETEREGFTGVRAFADEPGRHDVFLPGPDGAYFTLNTGTGPESGVASAAMDASTGCRPPAAQ